MTQSIEKECFQLRNLVHELVNTARPLASAIGATRTLDRLAEIEGLTDLWRATPEGMTLGVDLAGDEPDRTMAQLSPDTHARYRCHDCGEDFYAVQIAVEIERDGHLVLTLPCGCVAECGPIVEIVQGDVDLGLLSDHLQDDEEDDE